MKDGLKELFIYSRPRFGGGLVLIDAGENSGIVKPLITLIASLAALLAARPTRAQDAACASCHGDRSMAAALAGDSAKGARLFVDPAVFKGSVHGKMGFGCTMCHQGMSAYPHTRVTPVDCSGCHSGTKEQVAHSVHGRVHPVSGTVPATCADCHGSHDIRPRADPKSSVNRLTQFETCARCHSNRERMARFGQQNVEAVPTYLESVHGRALVEKGLSVAPVCTDCHGQQGTGAHQIQVVSSAESPMNRAHVVQTCGRCHSGIVQAYDRGIHGQEYDQGNPDVPTCIDCHTEHAVQPITSPGSSVYPTHIARTCSRCHEREDLNARYGLPSARRDTYLGSFHGIALEAGQLTVANCESCHGAHDILPASDSASSINPANLAQTCGRCHPGIGERVTEGKIHVASVRKDINLFAYGVQWMYYALIAGIVVFAASMIALDQYRHWVVDPRRRGQDHG